MEEGIQYLRELAVLEAIYRGPNNHQSAVDPDEVHYKQSMWQKFLQSAALLYINSLALLSMKEGEQTVLQVPQLWQH